MTIIRDYAITFGAFIAVDLLWLVFVARSFYQKYLGHLMSTQVNWFAAILFYLLFIAGLLFFVIYPALDKESFNYVLLAGALFGLMTYATYDLTNLATLKDWPLVVTIVDLIWGTVLSTATSALSFLIIKRF